MQPAAAAEPLVAAGRYAAEGKGAMEPLYYVMAILGCGDDGAACQQARVDTVRYQSVAQCQAAMGTVLQRHSDLSFPVIQAACQRRGLDVASRGADRRG